MVIQQPGVSCVGWWWCKDKMAHWYFDHRLQGLSGNWLPAQASIESRKWKYRQLSVLMRTSPCRRLWCSFAEHTVSLQPRLQRELPTQYRHGCCRRSRISFGNSLTSSPGIRGDTSSTPLCVCYINPLNPELNPICYLLALLAHHFLHVSGILVKSLTLRLLMSYIYIYDISSLRVKNPLSSMYVHVQGEIPVHTEHQASHTALLFTDGPPV